MVFPIKIPFFVLFLFINFLPSSLSTSPPFPCFFIFGDSFTDSGNNNRLNTTAKANYSPYGVDFPHGATGRFTNGRTVADFLAEMLGFDGYIPAFAEVQGGDVINGVNYASGSSGILSETGEQVGFLFTLDRQLQNHNITISRFVNLLGNTTAKERLNKCLYYFEIGGNDYINNYYIPQYYNSSKLYTPDQFATVLSQQYSQQLKKIYDFGARKISVTGLGQLGCLPVVLARGTNGSSCNESINDAVRLFNDKLKVVVDGLNNNLTDAKFIYISAMDLKPKALIAHGVKLLHEPCCKVSNIGLCIRDEAPCLDRAAHYFYDNFHPTEIVNKIAAPPSYIEILKLVPQLINKGRHEIDVVLSSMK